MSQWPLIGIALLGLAGVAFYCVPHDATHIQHDITTRTTQKLQDSNIAIPDGALIVDGRDVTLKGFKGSPIVSAKSQQVVESVWGVRHPVKVIEETPIAAPPPAPLPVEAQKVEVDLSKFLEGKNIRFDTNSEAIHPEGQLVLNEVFRILASSPTVAVDITGHTDNIGVEAFNLYLSKLRAVAVKKYLVARGIKPERLETEGFGSAKPIAPNDTEPNRARNRRIEFHANGRIPGAALNNK